MDNLQRLEIPESYRKLIQTRQSTETEAASETPEDRRRNWSGAGDPDCPKCHGGGFQHDRRQDGTIDYSHDHPCSCYGWWKGQGRIERDIQSFDNFRQVSGSSQALKRAREIADGSANYIWLLIYGRPGCGKTHLLRAIEATVKARGMWASYHTVPELFTAIRSGIADNSADALLQSYKQAQYLLLDEWGMEYGTLFERSRFDELMESRFRNLMITVVATNLDLAVMSERILSRFKDSERSRIVLNDAADYRPLKGK